LKAIAILVVTDELAKFGDAVAGNLFATELSNAVAVETDETFVSVLKRPHKSRYFATGGTAAAPDDLTISPDDPTGLAVNASSAR
jgi:hypothetical protein